jgi:hypothetical protein
MFKKIIIIFAISILIIGCDNKIVDTNTKPVPPQGVAAIAQNNQVYLSWYQNYESNVAGYNVYVSESSQGKFSKIGFTSKTEFLDQGAKNSVTYYYAVTAYNTDGFESNLSLDNAFATPRPEVFSVTLYDYKTNPNRAGYRLGSNAILAFDNTGTDIYFENTNSIYYMNVFKDSDIQDMGYTATFDEIAKSPTKGWSPTKDVQVISGHTYVVWTYDNHYAKFRVTSIYSDRVIFDCSFQLQSGNPYLKRSETKNERVFTQNIIK